MAGSCTCSGEISVMIQGCAACARLQEDVGLIQKIFESAYQQDPVAAHLSPGKAFLESRVGGEGEGKACPKGSDGAYAAAAVAYAALQACPGFAPGLQSMHSQSGMHCNSVIIQCPGSRAHSHRSVVRVLAQTCDWNARLRPHSECCQSAQSLLALVRCEEAPLWHARRMWQDKCSVLHLQAAGQKTSAAQMQPVPGRGPAPDPLSSAGNLA